MLRTAILRCLNVNRQKNHKHHRTKDIDLGILPKRQKDTLSYLTYSRMRAMIRVTGVCHKIYVDRKGINLWLR
nr:MAG TPA: hypothetical protein [Caudoviricetes sp.]